MKEPCHTSDTNNLCAPATGDILKGVSREVNSIFGRIQNSLDLIDLSSINADVKRYVETARRASAEGNVLVGSLLNFLTPAATSESSIERAVRSAVTLLLCAHRQSLSITLSTPGGIAAVRASEDALLSTVLSLLTMLHLHRRGDIAHIACSLDCVNSARGQSVRLSIQSADCSVSAEELQQYSCCLSEMDGTLSTTTHDDGSMGIRLTFPVAVSSASQEHPGTGDEERSHLEAGSEAVLIVDDDEELALTLRDMLEHLGYRAMIVSSGAEALRVIDKGETAFDLYIVDLVLPVMDGETLVHLIQEASPEARIILTSGADLQSQRVSLSGQANIMFMQKPFSLKSISTMVRSMLDSSAPARRFKQHINRIRISYVREESPAYTAETATPEYIYSQFRHLGSEPKERFVVVFLSHDKKIIGHEEISCGSRYETVVFPQEVVKSALLADASHIILVHNHPSGEPKPSPDDLALTADIISACEIFGIFVLNHIIIGKERYFALNNSI